MQAPAGEAQSEHAALLQTSHCLALLQHGHETAHACQQLLHGYLNGHSQLWSAPIRGRLPAPVRDCAQRPTQLLDQAWAHPPSLVNWPLVDQPVPPRTKVMKDHNAQHFERHATLAAMPRRLEMDASRKDLEMPWRRSDFPLLSSICANSEPDYHRATVCCQPSAYAPFWAAKH